MKKDIKPDDELVTRGILRRALLPLKRADAKLREEMHEMEYRLNNRMDERFNKIDDVLKKHVDAVQKLAEVVFPGQAG